MIIAIGAAICAFIGVSSNDGAGGYIFTSINGSEVEIYGKGIYQHDSLSMASQAIGQDYVILVLGIPALLLSWFFAKKTFRGLFVLAGTLGFFLYTYMSYSFTAMYNQLFLVYVLLMTCSLTAFIMVCINITSFRIKECFNERPRLNVTAIYLLAGGALLAVMWLSRIVPPLLLGTAPESIEHYSTLVIQVMDLGIVIPAMIIAGILTLKKNPIGYFLSVVLSIKALAMLISITAMMVCMTSNGVAPAMVEYILFGALNLVAFINVVLAVRSIKQPLNYK